jgi:multidrug efflux pump
VTLSEVCIKRPVFATVMTIVLVLIGAVSYSYLPLRQYPQVETPIVSVTTTFEGANPEVIETQVTKPIEGVLAGLEGLDVLRSISDAETSRITLIFKPNRSLDAAASDVRDRLARIKSRLPKEAEVPNIRKSDADAEPILHLALYSDVVSPSDIYEFADKSLKDQVEAIGGVSNVEVYGSAPYVMHVWLEPTRMAGYEITAQDVAAALKQQNIEIPAGRIISDEREFMVTTSANLVTPEQFENLILKEHKGYLVKLKDIGHADFSPGEQRSRVMYNGKPAIAIEVVKKSVANPLELVQELKAELPKLKESLPTGVEMAIAYDTTIYIERSIYEVYETLFIATFLVLLVVWGFLWSVRGAVIPLITIPVSLIGTFLLLYAFGFSINTLTLLALVLAIGLVVDDAIVMLENIHRHIEAGESPMVAAFKGSKEIAFAIIAMTLTLAAVYAPIALSQGRIGKIFTEFSLTLAGSVLISGFIALTLSPVMCSRLLLPHDLGKENISVRAQRRLSDWYGRTLAKVLNYRWYVLLFGVLFSLLGGYLGLYQIKSELAPREDKGVIQGKVTAPDGGTLKFVSPYVDEMDRIFASVPEIDRQLTVVTLPTAISYNLLKPWEVRSRSVQDIMQEIKYKLWDIPGVDAWPSAGPSFFGGGGSGESVQFVIQTTKTFEELVKFAISIEIALTDHPGFSRITIDISQEAQQYVVDIDREKAAESGVEIQAIGETLDTLVSGRTTTRMNKEGEQYEVKSQIVGETRRSPQDINMIYMKGQKGKETAMVPLANLVQLKSRAVPKEINHYNQLRSVTVSTDLNPGFSLGEAIDFLNKVKEVAFPEDFRSEFAGETKRFLETQNTVYLIFGMALAFIFLVMAAQFESFSDPFIIMFSVPISLTGALIALKLTGGTFNIFSQIGLVTLIGLITKHGILIVDFANNLRDQGLSKFEAVVEASRLRLRPILMTTGAMVLGALPLALASGAGHESRQQIGWVIVGGMLIGTIFTLFVVPTVYTFFSPSVRKPLPEFTEEGGLVTG